MSEGDHAAERRRNRASAGSRWARGLEPPLEGVRLAVLTHGAAPGDRLAEALRARGAEVMLVDPEEPEAARSLDPQIVLYDGSLSEGVLRPLRKEPRTRWAVIAPFRWAVVLPVGSTAANVEALLPCLQAAAGAERALSRALRERESPFEVPFGHLGTARLIRAVSAAGQSARLIIDGWDPREDGATTDRPLWGSIDLAGGVLAEATVRGEGADLARR